MLATLFEGEDARHIAEAFQCKLETGDLWVDSTRVPGRGIGLPSLLRELGAFESQTLSARHWRLANNFMPLVLEMLEQISVQRVSNSPLSPEELKARLERQERAGFEAEEWVLNYERLRLEGHLLLDGIRQVSKEDVSLGYDIASFSSGRALAFDRFIEVKSFENKPRFYWTRGEIKAAKRLGEKYYLYLVDRSKMGSKDYKPMTVQGPASCFLNDLAPDWSSDCSEMFFEMR